MNTTILCAILSSLILYVNCEVVEVQNGLINGTVGYTRNGRVFLKFFGIPYAEPPVGELRLKPPVAAKPWSGVKNCAQPSSRCIQADLFSVQTDLIVGNEDCLYLNVFVPKDLFKPSGKTPVMVAIHGGAYKYGTGIHYAPDYFMDGDVIFVSINYRLGALGFLGLNNDVISGNFGMKDQSLALRWVHENIARFGGDPGNVTLVGESAGAASVHLHMFSPLSAGLFQKAIMQSGSAFATWAHHNLGQGEAVGTAFLVISGCFRKDPVQILKCLQRLPVEKFHELEKRLKIWNNEPVIVFKPMIESNVTNQPFLTQKPANNTYLTKVPWITGINSGEGALTVAFYLRNGAALAKALNANKKDILPLLGEYYDTTDVENLDNVTQKVVDYYFGTKDIGMETALKFVDMITDSVFMYPFMKTVQSQNGSQYVYFYDHRGTFTLVNFAHLPIDLGVCHADELSLLFRNIVLEVFWSPKDRNMSQILVKFWTNFAISGDPNGHSGDKIWKPVETKDLEYLHIQSDSLLMENQLLKEEFDFWDSLPIGWK